MLNDDNSTQNDVLFKRLIAMEQSDEKIASLVTESAAGRIRAWLEAHNWHYLPRPGNHSPGACGICGFRQAIIDALKEGQ